MWPWSSGSVGFSVALAWLALTGLACSKGGSGPPVKQPDGSYRLECKSPLSACLERAEQLCRDQGYVVAEARDRQELLGHEQGQSQVEVRRSEATVFCGGESGPQPRAMVEVKGDPMTPKRRERPTEEPNPYPERASSPEPSARCVPGAAQACIGPAGCTGGQVCNDDGSRFGGCDCGNPKAP